MKTPSHSKRGRPPKFGRPSQVVALTLPDEVVRGLRKIDRDLAWAIVALVEKIPRRPRVPPPPQHDAELTRMADGRSLIVVNRAVFTKLPGVSIIPLSGDRAFLALDVGRGVADLELAVVDRLERGGARRREHQALIELRSQLRKWRLNRMLRFHSRAIIVVERLDGRARRGAS